MVYPQVAGEQDGYDDEKRHDAPADHHGFGNGEGTDLDHLHVQLLFEGCGQSVHRAAPFHWDRAERKLGCTTVFTRSPFVFDVDAKKHRAVGLPTRLFRLV